MVVPFLKTGTILTVGESEIVQQLDRRGRKFYAVEYVGNDKRALVLAPDKELLEKLGIKTAKHWNQPDSKDILSGYGIKFHLYDHTMWLPTPDKKIAEFLFSTTNEDFTTLLNEEEPF